MASEASLKKYNNKIKNNLWTPSPTQQTSTQNPTSDKSQGGGGFGFVREGVLCWYFIGGRWGSKGCF